MELNDASILVTGGTGSFGKSFIKTVLKRWPKVRRLVVFSRDEQKQYQMAQELPPGEYKALRYFIGDVRDYDRLKRAFEGIDYVIHAAAMKHVPIAEYNPIECIKTNVNGAENVITAALDSGVKRVVALSTDKASSPINLYGATKLCSDKLFIAANNFKGTRDIRFSVVRYGNVMGSNGSVIPYFLKQRESGRLTITDNRMTRFNITLDHGVDMVLQALADAWGGEIFVPRIPSYRITDLAEAIGPDCQIDVTGIRPGEKLHEEMVSASDSPNTVRSRENYIILPSRPSWNLEEYAKTYSTEPVEAGFSYNSGDNEDFLDVETIRELIRTHLDPSFSAG
ncbi:MAG: UDP-N-acetylglucosamine 4,6-dehydratase (inverting) [Puniceicoccaceae bacterium]